MSSDLSPLGHNTEIQALNRQQIADIIPPARIDPNRAGVHPDFLATWNESVQSESALCEFVGKEFSIPSPEEQPQTFAHVQDELNVFNLATEADAPYQFKPVWSRSFWGNTITALATCLAFRRPNAQERSSPSEQSNFPDYSIPYRILIDFVRTMEVIYVQHSKHSPTSEDVSKFLESFDFEDPDNSVNTASAQFSWDMRHYFWEPPKLFTMQTTNETNIQTDLTGPILQTEEKDVEVLSPSSKDHASTQTESASHRVRSPPPKEEQTTTQPKQQPPPNTTLKTKSRVLLKGKRLSRSSFHSPKQPARDSLPTKSPSPKPTSESGCSSRHSPTRAPTRPHIVLTRVLNADEMDFRDVRREWDSALDGFRPPSPDLFRSSNIHRFRRFGSTGLGIIFRQQPTTKQLNKFITSCSKHKGRDSFNRAFCSVSNSGVMISLYDEAHRSPPHPTQLRFEEPRQPQWSPPPHRTYTQPTHREQHLYPRRFDIRRPAPPRFPTPQFGNAFQMHSPPQPNHFQSQLTQLQQQMHQIVQLQQQLFQQLQHLQQNAI